MENDLNIHFVVCPNKEIKLKYNTYGYAYYRYGIFIYCFFFLSCGLGWFCPHVNIGILYCSIYYILIIYRRLCYTRRFNV